MLIGGAILGAITSVVPQLLGTPIAVDESEQDEVEAVRGRLGNAVGIPMVALILLVLLVIPFGYTLIQSSHLTSGGASIVGILTASGILGFAALAGSKPEMKITFGDLLWAIVGLGTVLVIILAVLLYTGSDDHIEEGVSNEHRAAVQLI
jgi:peptidoglycan/LPS O-acetylase OafA/YrhL